jgi:hypothetical protein
MAALTPWSSRLTLLSFLLAACATEPEAGLVGYWKSAPENLEPSGSYETWLSFNSFGGFEQQVRGYGIYPGQGQNELSAYTKIKGTYRIEGDRLIFDSDRQAWWDPTFYGPDEHEAKDDSRLYDEGRFTLDGDHLVLHYISYPLDAPVATSAEFTRQR